MSFSSQVKDELNALPIKSNCCKKAYIFGVAASATVVDGVISVRLTDESTAEQFCHFLKNIYNIEPERKEINRGCYKAIELKFKSNKVSEFLSFADSFSDSDEDIDALSTFFKCKDCRSVFLRAVFCARGSVSDPKKSYSLEIHVPNDTRAMLVHSILEEIGPEAPGITPRKDGYGIFYRNESAIEYVLSVIGANKTVFDFLDAYVEKDYRNAEKSNQLRGKKYCKISRRGGSANFVYRSAYCERNARRTVRGYKDDRQATYSKPRHESYGACCNS